MNPKTVLTDISLTDPSYTASAEALDKNAGYSWTFQISGMIALGCCPEILLKAEI